MLCNDVACSFLFWKSLPIQLGMKTGASGTEAPPGCDHKGHSLGQGVRKSLVIPYTYI